MLTPDRYPLPNLRTAPALWHRSNIFLRSILNQLFTTPIAPEDVYKTNKFICSVEICSHYNYLPLCFSHWKRRYSRAIETGGTIIVIAFYTQAIVVATIIKTNLKIRKQLNFVIYQIVVLAMSKLKCLHKLLEN